jgi:hypothetical protein
MVCGTVWLPPHDPHPQVPTCVADELARCPPTDANSDKYRGLEGRRDPSASRVAGPAPAAQVRVLRQLLPVGPGRKGQRGGAAADTAPTSTPSGTRLNAFLASSRRHSFAVLVACYFLLVVGTTNGVRAYTVVSSVGGPGILNVAKSGEDGPACGAPTSPCATLRYVT